MKDNAMDMAEADASVLEIASLQERSAGGREGGREGGR